LCETRAAITASSLTERMGSNTSIVVCGVLCCSIQNYCSCCGCWILYTTVKRVYTLDKYWDKKISRSQNKIGIYTLSQ
jgi:hypothetical protein